MLQNHFCQRTKSFCTVCAGYLCVFCVYAGGYRPGIADTHGSMEANTAAAEGQPLCEGAGSGDLGPGRLEGSLPPR